MAQRIYRLTRVFKYGLDFYKHIQIFPSEHQCNVILECLCFPEKCGKFKDSYLPHCIANVHIFVLLITSIEVKIMTNVIIE
jgi:hypothetical protein